MQIITSFTGPNRDFRPWLAAQKYPVKVVSLAEHKRKKAAKRAARIKPYTPIIA